MKFILIFLFVLSILYMVSTGVKTFFSVQELESLNFSIYEKVGIYLSISYFLTFIICLF